jgi:hypothetical protein
MARMKIVVISIVTLIFIGTMMFGCVEAVEESDRPCPCGEGWVCCKSEGVCKPEGEFCNDNSKRDGYFNSNLSPHQDGSAYFPDTFLNYLKDGSPSKKDSDFYLIQNSDFYLIQD